MAASEEDEMKNEIKCLRCGGEMELIRKEYLQLGKTGWFIGDWGNLLAGALWVNIMACPRCGKLEFFRGDGPESVGEEENGIAQTTCPGCGRRHDMDDPKCPACGMKNPIFN